MSFSLRNRIGPLREGMAVTATLPPSRSKYRSSRSPGRRVTGTTLQVSREAIPAKAISRAAKVPQRLAPGRRRNEIERASSPYRAAMSAMPRPTPIEGIKTKPAVREPTTAPMVLRLNVL